VRRRINEYGSEYSGSDGNENNVGQSSPRRLRTFESFKTPAYRVFFASLLGQWAAMSMQMMSRSLLVYRLTGSGTIIGVLALAQAVPQLLIGFLGGAIADRVQKKYLLIISQMLTGVISLLVAIALSVGYLSEENPGSWWVLVFTAIGQGTMMGLMTPARMAIIPEIVGEERVMNAVSLTMMGQTVFRLIGPALAGFLIEAYDFAAVYFFMTIMFLISTIIASFLPRTRRIPTLKGQIHSKMCWKVSDTFVVRQYLC
jgi:MFS family permease